MAWTREGIKRTLLNEVFSALGISSQATSEYSKPLTLARLGSIGAVVAYLPGEVVQASLATLDGFASVSRIIVVTAAWMMIYAIGYSLALIIGQNRYLHRPWLNPQEGAMALVGGSVFGVISGGLAQAFFSLAVAIGQGNILLIEMARIVAWAMFGSLIGFGMSFIIPNLGRIRGTFGGGAGGAIGAIAFIACTILAGDAIGRFIGMAIVGFALGYAIGLVEEASRTAWLQVTRGASARETVRVSLGPDIVCVGSNSQRCAVWAQGARAIALRFRFVDGKVLCDDMSTEQQMVVGPGFQQQVGNVTVTVCVVGAASGAGGLSSSASGTVAVPPPPPPRLPPPASRPSQSLNGQIPRSPEAGRVAPHRAATDARKVLSPPPPPPRPAGR